MTCGKSNSYGKHPTPQSEDPVPPTTASNVGIALRHKAPKIVDRSPGRRVPSHIAKSLYNLVPGISRWHHSRSYYNSVTGTKLPRDIINHSIDILPNTMVLRATPDHESILATARRMGGVLLDAQKIDNIMDTRRHLHSKPGTDKDSVYDLWLAALPDDELEVLILHYHDLWMWETGDKKHREKFEELLAERDLRAEKGFIIQRPSFSEAKKMYRGEPKTGISLRHKLRQREKLTPLTMPGMSRVLDAKSAYAWMGVPRRSSTTGKLDMWLRLDPIGFGRYRA